MMEVHHVFYVSQFGSLRRTSPKKNRFGKKLKQLLDEKSPMAEVHDESHEEKK